MSNLNKLSDLVIKSYRNSGQEFAQWMLKNHLLLVSEKTEVLCDRFGANKNIAVAGAWLHDFGDAFVHRHDKDHANISTTEGIKLLKQSGYSQEEIKLVMEEVIAYHSCKNGNLPTTLEGKVMASADALAHLSSDFYLQFAWMHLPENKSFEEYKNWVKEKIYRDFADKIFFEEVKDEIKDRYLALKEIFSISK